MARSYSISAADFFTLPNRLGISPAAELGTDGGNQGDQPVEPGLLAFAFGAPPDSYLGHYSAAFTLDTYAHLYRRRARDLGAELGPFNATDWRSSATKPVSGVIDCLSKRPAESNGQRTGHIAPLRRMKRQRKGRAIRP